MTVMTVGGRRSDDLNVGVRVDVRSRFVGSWSRGFEIAEVVSDGYVIRRLSDGSLLPEVFEPDDIRAEHRRKDMWWF